MAEPQTFVRNRFTPNKVKAMQCLPHAAADLIRWAKELDSDAYYRMEDILRVGDWVIYDEDGNLYSLPDAIFTMNYGLPKLGEE